jgi:probable rRNA maturation factor
MIHIKTNPNLSEHISSERLKKAALKSLEHQSVSKTSNITIVLTDDSQLHALNRDYLGIDAPTDVLSFPSDETDPETGKRYLGDIIISVPRASQQASAAGHPLEAEAQLLVVHGVLHLLGHDHTDAEEKKLMWRAQCEILDSIGLGHIQVHEE